MWRVLWREVIENEPNCQRVFARSDKPSCQQSTVTTAAMSSGQEMPSFFFLFWSYCLRLSEKPTRQQSSNTYFLIGRQFERCYFKSSSDASLFFLFCSHSHSLRRLSILDLGKATRQQSTHTFWFTSTYLGGKLTGACQAVTRTTTIDCRLG
jgi:hypothetical protein